MPKSPSTDLYDLIRSMSKAEKAAFAIYVKGRIAKDPLYPELFNLMERQKIYSEKKIIRKLNINPKRFPELKHYLHELVLKNLEAFYSGQNVDSQLASFLNIIQILFDKGLFEQCSKQVRKAKSLALKYEKHSFLIELLDREIKLSDARQHIGVSDEQLKDIHRQVTASHEKINLHNKYSLAVELPFRKAFLSGGTRNKKELAEIKHLFDKSAPPEKDMEKLPFRTKLLRYSFLMRYKMDILDYSGALATMKEALELMESQPHQISEYEKSYAAALANIINNLFLLKRHEEIPAYIKKLYEAPARSEKLKSYTFFKARSFEMGYCIDSGDFDKGLILVDEMENSLSKKKIVDANIDLTTLYFSAYIQLGAGNYSRANHYLQALFNSEHRGLRVDLYGFAKILSLIVWFELNDRQHLEYAVRSVYRYLSKRKRLYKLETTLLEFIRKEVPKMHSRSEQLSAFNKLKEELTVLAKDPFEQGTFGYFDFISWLESKIEDKPFADCVRRKAKL